MNKRSSRRYTYLPQAKIASQTADQTIQIRDVSKSGVQFFSNAVIRNNSPILINWQDQGIGYINPFVMVVRRIDQPGVGAFRFNYGSQFFNLRQDTKSNIEKLLSSTKAGEIKDNHNLVQKITVDALVEIIKEGRAFLQRLIKGTESSKLFARFTRDLKPYEKDSFSAMDDESQMTQKLTMHDFHCNLLNIAIPLTPKNNPQGFELYKETVKKIEGITDVIIEARLFKNSKFVEESTNRLFYNKLELLQTFVETYESESMPEEQSESIQKIIREYRQTSPKTRRTAIRRTQ